MDLTQRMAAVKLWLCDVDGVLTDGRIMLDAQGQEWKTFDVRDGHGLVMLQRAGIRTGFITGRSSHAVTQRANELSVTWVVQGSRDKIADVHRIAAEAGVGLDAIAYMGDDVVDIPVLRSVGLASAPSDAHQDVQACVHYVAQARGGRGAAREVAEKVLQSQGHWEPMMNELRGA